jgi:preprotein translocase subunit YajC
VPEVSTCRAVINKLIIEKFMFNMDELGLKFTKIAQQTTVEAQEVILEEPAAKSLFSKENFVNLLPLLVIFGIFYFFIIRPQLKKQKEQADLINALKKGDQVIVAGGIIGKIIKEKDPNTFLIEVAKDVHLEILKSSVVSLVNKAAFASKKS